MQIQRKPPDLTTQNRVRNKNEFFLIPAQAGSVVGDTSQSREQRTFLLVPPWVRGILLIYICTEKADDHAMEMNGCRNNARVLVLGEERVSEVTPNDS